MPFKKVNPKDELEKICKEDKEIVQYTKEFDEEYELDSKIIKRLKNDDGSRYSSEEVRAIRDFLKKFNIEDFYTLKENIPAIIDKYSEDLKDLYDHEVDEVKELKSKIASLENILEKMS